jgi:uncharacterized membrane protein YfcA
MTLLLLMTGLIGLLLGMLGGGGSVLAVPVLVYLAHMEPRTAMATSLVLVATTSSMALIGHAHAGRVCWKTGWLFGAAGMAGAYLGGRLAAFISGNVLLLMFGAVMLGTAVAMLKRPRPASDDSRRSRSFCPRHLPLWAILFDGFGVGALAGLVGAGGGFLVVPALVLLGGLHMHAAVGTSLLIVAMQSSAALAGYVSHVDLDWHLTGLITLAAMAGSVLGTIASPRISQPLLRRVFGLLVMAVAGYLLYRELSWDLLNQLHELVKEHREFFMGLASVPAIAILLAVRKRLRSGKSVKLDRLPRNRISRPCPNRRAARHNHPKHG